MGLVLSLPLWAHTLPISNLTVVPGEDHVHLELVFNPFELNFVAELDANRDGRLDASEFAAQESSITKLLLKHLKLSVDGQALSPDISGLAQDSESHHFTLRAHYPADARQRPVTIESELHAITSGSHITQVSFGSGENRLAARLDMSAPKVTFGTAVGAAKQPGGRYDISTAAAVVLWVIAVLPALVVVLGLIWCQHREFHPKRTT